LLPPTELPLDVTIPAPSAPPQAKRAVPSSQGGGAPIPMRAPLYPKYLRRLSSGSDDSFIYSHNETISDQSDLELRIRTLKDQLNKRKQEAERLKKELKTVRAENLKAKEASLVQQIRFYDKHIQLSSQELENEKQSLNKPAQIMRKPLILKPQKKINTTKSGNMSSVEENSDQTHSSHDYHKETFDTESDKLDASDSTTVKDKESNDSLEPSVHAVIGEDTKVQVAEETVSGEKYETINVENVQTSIETTSSPEEISTELNESVDESANKFELEVRSTQENTHNEDGKSVVDVVEQIETVSKLHSDTASEIQTEMVEQSSREVEEEFELSSSEKTVESGQDVATDGTKHVISDESLVLTGRIVSSVETNIETGSNSVETNVEMGRESVETHIETGQESLETSGVVKTEKETSLENSGDVQTGRESSERSNIEFETQLDSEGDYEEKDHESEVLHVSLKERTIYETFIVHEESVETMEECAGSEEDIEEEISENEAKEDNTAEATSDVFKPLYLSPRELELPLKETTPREDGVSVKETTPTEDITTDCTEDATVDSNDEEDTEQCEHASEHFLSHSEPKTLSEIKQPMTAVQNFTSAAMPELTAADISDILSPNISDLHEILEKDFINLDNFTLPLQLSPSKAPHTPFLHALSRDYHMTRKYQLEQLSNEIVDNELNASIDSMLVVYKERRVLNEEAVTADEKEVDLKALGSHQKDLSWTSEDDWYTDEFDLELAGPPSVVAQVLLQKERQIDQEIEKIKQLTSSISSLDEPGAVLDTSSPRKLFSGAYPYLRHIPDKPPPPYIEPATSVPSSEGEISTIVLAMVDSLMNPDKEIEIPSSKIPRIQMYYTFLYDLTKDVYTKVTTSATTGETLPWQRPRVKTKLLDKKPLPEPQRIVNRVCHLLFLHPTPSCNNFILDWSRPKRDPVDEIIVQEARVEETMWTGYHTQETEIKNQVTETLLQELLDETVGIFQGLLTRGRSKA
ncbi:hypothetical protein WDU94_001469, partial [Cyamophila willieti]